MIRVKQAEDDAQIPLSGKKDKAERNDDSLNPIDYANFTLSQLLIGWSGQRIRFLTRAMGTARKLIIAGGASRQDIKIIPHIIFYVYLTGERHMK